MTIGRNLSSLLFFLLITGCVLWDLFTHLHVFPIVVFLGATVAVVEVSKMTRAMGARPWTLGIWVLVMLLVGDGWQGKLAHAEIIIMAAVLLLFAQALTRPIAGALASVGGGLLTALWIGLGFGSLLALWSWNGLDGATREGRYLVVFLMPVAMFQDIAAMWTGAALGKHRLAPTLSPHKTVEGAIGGLLGSALMAMVLWGIYSTFETAHEGLPLRNFLTWWDALALGLLFGSVGQIGDLCESLLKREAGVKDSGITGTAHGGVLDVVDSILFCAPVMYLWAWVRGLWMFG